MEIKLKTLSLKKLKSKAKLIMTDILDWLKRNKMK